MRASNWPFLTMIAFLDQDVRQLAREFSAHVDVIARLDLARGRDHAGQVFAHDLAGLHGDNAAAVVPDAGHHAGGDQEQDDECRSESSIWASRFTILRCLNSGAKSIRRKFPLLCSRETPVYHDSRVTVCK